MAAVLQPAKKSYFFGKGYRDVGNTIKGAWRRNFVSLRKFKNNITMSRISGDGRTTRLFKLVLNVLAMLSVLIYGSIITAVVSVINIAVVFVVMAVIYLGFSIIWLVDRLYLIRKHIFTACHECKEKSLIPTYICPRCGAQHTNLTPGVYGILKRRCNCGEKLPTTFFNGRKNLDAICPHCGTLLSNREAVPICIPIVGGRSVGKTAFITAFSKEFIDEVAPAKSWETEFYNDAKADMYKEIEQDYRMGSTRMTDRPQDVNKTSSISFSFFVKGAPFSPERLVHVYDIAGEVFTDNSENEIQKQYEYCQGIVLMVDPFAIPKVRNKCEGQLEPEDVAGLGKADINEIVDSFLNKLREVTGMSDKNMSSVPLAVVIGKIDSAGIRDEIGDLAIKSQMDSKPELFKNYYDTMDHLCRKFLKENGMESFINNVDLKFKDNRYFACTAIGHTRDKGQYNPQGVLAPMQWLFGKADSKMYHSWNDIKFSRKIPKITESAT